MTGSSSGASAVEPTDYAGSGVSIEAGDRAVELMKASIKSADRPEVVGGIGGFAGLFDASALKNYRRPLLAASADGVGTKIQIAQRMDVHDTIGFDLVGMLVDDLVVCGAEPLFMTDYIACGRMMPERIADIVNGIAGACAQTGTALLGGETAEHPGLMGPDEYDIAGSTTGVVEAERQLGPDRVRPGDAVVAMASSGLHANGYSLARRVFFDKAGWQLDRDVPEFGRTLGEELLEPTGLYTKQMLALIDAVDVHAIAHITGGGLAANVERIIPCGVTLRVDRGTWQLPPIFSTIGRLGSIEFTDIEQTLNMGVGMVAIVDAGDGDAAASYVNDRGITAWVAGTVGAAEVPDEPGTVTLAGSYGRAG